MFSGVGSISWLVWRGHGRVTTCELYAKIIAESELLQPALNEIHKFCFQHWSRGRDTCGTGSGAPDVIVFASCSLLQLWATSAISLQAGAYFLKCQMTTDCTPATTRRTSTPATATPATARVDVLWLGTPDEMSVVSADKINFCYTKHWIEG